jgi:cyclase
MFVPRIIPVLLLKGKGLVKTTKFNNKNYIGDPINTVKIFNDLKADELIFLDITASREGRTISVDLVEKIGDEAFMPFTVGGGIDNERSAVDLIMAGAEKIVFNTAFVKSPEMVSKTAALLGNQSVIVSIDTKKNFFGKYRVHIYSGKKRIPYDPVSAARRAEDLGAGEILITSINFDGIMTGYDLELIQQVSEAVSIPVIANGGAGNLFHMREAVYIGAHAVAAGSMFVYHGPRKGVLINYPSKNEVINIFLNDAKS